MTLVVNLFAGPGTGKSTNTALVFGKLKTDGVNAEIVHEFAKDLVWEERHTALAFQPYIVGKQLYHIHRLIGKVDVIITDAPVLFCSHIYGNGEGYADAELKAFVLKTFKQWDTYNVFLERDSRVHPYVEAGRNQDLNEAQLLDRKILTMLRAEGIPYRSFPILDSDRTAEAIAINILVHLKLRKIIT